MNKHNGRRTDTLRYRCQGCGNNIVEKNKKSTKNNTQKNNTNNNNHTNNNVNSSKSLSMFGCRICEFDLCEICYSNENLEIPIYKMTDSENGKPVWVKSYFENEKDAQVHFKKLYQCRTDFHQYYQYCLYKLQNNAEDVDLLYCMAVLCHSGCADFTPGTYKVVAPITNLTSRKERKQ
eukprot:UN29450